MDFQKLYSRRPLSWIGKEELTGDKLDILLTELKSQNHLQSITARVHSVEFSRLLAHLSLF